MAGSPYISCTMTLPEPSIQVGPRYFLFLIRLQDKTPIVKEHVPNPLELEEGMKVLVGKSYLAAYQPSSINAIIRDPSGMLLPGFVFFLTFQEKLHTSSNQRRVESRW